MTSVNGKAELPGVVQAAFDPGAIVEVAKCRSVYKLVTPGGRLIVKPLQTGSGKAWLTARLLRGNHSCPVLAGLYDPERFPHYFWGRGSRYLITREIPGREADYLQTEDLQAAIRSMHEFHRYSQRLIRDEPEPWRLVRYDPVCQWKRWYHEMERCRELAIGRRDAWSRQYLKYWHYFGELASRAIGELENYPTVDRLEAICYHDWAHHNVILANGAAYLIDFDYMLIDHPAHDRSNLTSRYLRLHGWSSEALLRLLWDFDRYYPWRRGELKLLWIYLTFPYEYWMIGRQYYLEKQPWSLKYYGDQWKRKVASWEQREALLHLLEQF